MKTEQVLGQDVKVGDILRIEGFRWRVVSAPVLGEGNCAGQERYLIEVEGANDAARAMIAWRWHSGLRVDLTWTRETRDAPCSGYALCSDCKAAIAASDKERREP